METLKGRGKSIKKEEKVNDRLRGRRKEKGLLVEEEDSTYIIGPMVPGSSHTSSSTPPFSSFLQFIPSPE